MLARLLEPATSEYLQNPGRRNEDCMKEQQARIC